jgi:antitoxin component of MazEF toxin-antitoxin module
MVDLKFRKKLIGIGPNAVAIHIPQSIVNKYNLKKGALFELDVMEEPDFVLLFKKIVGEDENEKSE